MLLLLDNYDSFVHNLARYIRLHDHETTVRRSDEIDVAEIEQMAIDAIVISPGPGVPRDAGCCLEVVQRVGARLPILGVCLGHQVIVEAYGGQVVCEEPLHGSASDIHHDGSELFASLPNPFPAARYHSLVAEPNSLPDELEVTAWTEDEQVRAGRIIMGLQHKTWPVFGVQFHPESILTDVGMQLIGNFLQCVSSGSGANTR